MKVMCRNGDIGKMFEPLMKGARVAPKPDIALKVTTCKRNEVKNKTVLLHSVYPLKDAARDNAAHEITPEHWNNRITTWTNIFDGKKDCMGDELDWRKTDSSICCSRSSIQIIKRPLQSHLATH